MGARLGPAAPATREGARLGLAILAVLCASSIPYALGYAVAPADRTFLGIVSGVLDWAQYRAWMRAHMEHVLIENVLTCEPQSPAFFNLQWFLLGRAAGLLGLSFAAVLQVFRLGVAAFFLWLTHRVCRSFFAGEPARTWAAWILINLSSGFGWIWVLEKRLISGELRHFLDLYVAEPVTFQNVINYPHFLVAAILLLLVFRLAAAAVDSGSTGPPILAGVLALVLGLTHAYDLVIVYGVLGVFAVLLVLRDGFSWRPALVAALIAAPSLPPPLYFTYLTSQDPLWAQVLAQFPNAGVHTPDPLHLLVLVGLPLLLAILTFDGLWPAAGLASWPLLVRVWCVVNFFLLYIPGGFQVHMLNGWQIPLGLLATAGLFDRLLPRLRAIGGLAAALTRTDARVLGLLLVLVLPTNLYLLVWRVREVLRLEHDHYLYRDELEAAAWLDEHTADSDVVFSGLVLGQHLPALAGNKVYLGHWAQTVYFERKRRSLRTFFAASTPDDERLHMLRDCHVRFLVYGREERQLGDLDPDRLSYLELVYTRGETRVYRTLLPAGSVSASQP